MNDKIPVGSLPKAAANELPGAQFIGNTASGHTRLFDVSAITAGFKGLATPSTVIPTPTLSQVWNLTMPTYPATSLSYPNLGGIIVTTMVGSQYVFNPTATWNGTVWVYDKSLATIPAGVDGASVVSATGTVLPTPATKAIAFVGAGTFTYTGGTINTTEKLTQLSWDLTSWSVGLAVSIAEGKSLPWVAQSYISGSQVNYLGTTWQSNAAVVSTDVPGTSTKWVDLLSAKTNNTDLFDYNSGDSTNLATSFENGYWGSTLTGGKSTTITTLASSVNAIDTVAGDVLYFYGIPNTYLDSANPIIRTYNASGAAIATIPKTSLVPINGVSGAYTYNVTGSTVVKFGLNVLKTETSTAIVRKSAIVLPSTNVKQSLSSKIKTLWLDNTDGFFVTLTALLSYVKGIDLFNNTTIPVNLATTVVQDKNWSSTGSFITAAGYKGVQTKINISALTNLAIGGLTQNNVAAYVGRYFLADGTYYGNALRENLTKSNTGYVFTKPVDANIYSIGFFFEDAALPTIGALTIQAGIDIITTAPAKKILASLIPATEIAPAEVGVVAKSPVATFEHAMDIQGLTATQLTYLKKGASSAFKKVVPFKNNPLIIIAGQSQINGRIPIANAPSYFKDAGNKLLNVMMQTSQTAENWHEYNTSDYGTTGTFGWDLMLYKMLVDYLRGLAPDSKLYVVKNSLGGTSIAKTTSGGGYWSADYEDITDPKRKLLFELELMYRQAVNSSLNINFSSLGNMFIWDQHEGDSATADANNYAQNFKNVLYDVRGFVGNVKFPALLMGTNSSSSQYSAIVEATKVALAAEDPFCIYVPTSNDPTQLQSDGIHLNSAGGLAKATAAYNAIIANKLIFRFN
jgi:hypothetical protein